MSKHKCPKCGSENTKETNIAGKIASDVASGIFLGGALILRKMFSQMLTLVMELSIIIIKPEKNFAINDLLDFFPCVLFC